MRIALRLVPVIGSLVLLLACERSEMPAPAASHTSVPTIDVVKVVSQPLQTTVRLPGELQPYEVVAVFAKISGFVDSIAVDRGSNVKAGQLMARLVAPEIVSQRAEAQAKIESAQSQLAAVQAKLAGDESTYTKLRSASMTPGVVSGNDVVLAQKAAEADQAQVRSAAGTVESAKQAEAAIASLEKYLIITAPFDGVVTERNIHPGALVGPNQATPLLRIETLKRLRVLIPVPETYAGSIPKDAKVTFSVAAFPETIFEGTLARVSNSVDMKTRSMPVELDVSNSSGQLVPGTYADVRWPVHRAESSLFVPASAVTSNLERTFVECVRNGKIEWVDVKVGATQGKLVEIFGELRPEDRVALRGTDELTSGAQVTLHEVQAP